MKKTTLGALIVATAAFLSLASEAQADIVFGAATNIGTEAGDVITDGILHAAVNGAEDSEADVTLNGQLFQSGDINAATNVSTTGFTSSNAAELNPNGLGDTAEYQRFLGDIDFGGGDPATVNIDNLTIGNAYRIQVWFLDNRDNANDDRVTTVAGVGAGANSVALNDQFAIGDFVATSTTESFTVSTAGSASPNLTGFQVRDLGVAVPEPSSLALLTMGISGLFLRRRRS